MAETTTPPRVRKGQRRWTAGAAARVSLADAASLGTMAAPPLVMMAPIALTASPLALVTTPSAPVTGLVPFTGLYPLSVSALASSRDTRQIQDPREMVLEIHKWAAPFAQRVATKFGMYIPFKVDYSFEKLPTHKNPDGSFSRVNASVNMQDPARYVIKIDLENCRENARDKGMTLHDYLAGVQTHELGHIAKKTNQKVVQAVAQLRDLEEITKVALAHSQALLAEGRIDIKQSIQMLRAKVRVDEIADVTRAVFEGFGDHVMSEAMTQAAAKDRLDNPNWSYDPADSDPKYANGKRFIDSMMADPNIGPAGVTRLLRLTHGQSELLPKPAQIENDYAGWVNPAAHRLMSAQESDLSPNDAALFQLAKILLEYEDPNSGLLPNTQATALGPTGFSPQTPDIGQAADNIIGRFLPPQYSNVRRTTGRSPARPSGTPK